MGHFQLREDGSSTMVEQLELSGSKSFYVSPNSKNETQAPIRGSAIVSILGKNYNIQLTHKVKDYTDPEPSSTKWSYIENMYVTGNTPVATADVKNQDTAYVRASRGQTLYITNNSIITKLFVSKAYTNYQNVLDTVGDFSGTTYATQYEKGVLMELFTFTMYYKYSTEEGGTVIPPVDDGTPASNKARIPCRPDVSSAPDWITNVVLRYVINYTLNGVSGSTSYTTWEQFIAFWDSIQTNPAYSDAVFHYVLRGTISFNELLTQRGNDSITISEIDNGKGVGIHGAKPLYLNISQQEGKTLYGISMVPAAANMLDTGYGMWFFDDLTNYEISANRLSKYSAGTYNLRPKFRIQSANKAFNIATVTGGSMIVNPEGAGTVSYQYIGQPFILKVFKETANGIEKNYLRPYYKQTGTSQNTSLWKTDVNLMGAQNFNPLQYDQWSGEFYYLHVRNSGYRGFLSGPMSGNYGLAIFQLIPMSLYPMFGVNPYTVNDDIDGEGGVGTKGVNYVNRYTNYQSAIGSVSNDDRYKAAFLKWPNEDGNNNPDHISPGVVESLLSKMGKNWENSYQNNSNYSIVDRVMMVPVLWTETRLEDSSDFRTALSNDNPGFGHYLFSPYAPDSELDDSRIDSVYRIHINGLDIQMR